jgi:hypothetical protein
MIRAWNARTTIAVALVCFLAGATSGWTVNGWRLGNAIEAQKTKAATELAKATQRARSAEKAQDKIRIEAEVNHAKARDQIERTLADNRRLARQLGGLRDPGHRPGGDCAVPGGAQAAGERDAGATGSELPDQTAGLLSVEASDFLIELAAEADRAAEYARTCHNWAMKVSNGK